MIRAGLLIKRIPQITHNLDKLSHAYYLYKTSLAQDNARPFEKEFYFKKGSLGEAKWIAENADKSGSQVRQPRENLDLPSDRSVKATDTKSLDRKLDGTLYFIVKKEDDWEFADAELKEEEFLHECSDRLATEVLGDVDVWRVGKAPVGHIDKTFFIKYHILPGSNPTSDLEFAWMDKEECRTQMKPDYYNQIKDMIS